MTEETNETTGDGEVRRAIRRVDGAASPTATDGSGRDAGVRESDGGREAAIDPEGDIDAEAEAPDPFAGDDPRSQVLRSVRDAFGDGAVDAPFEAPDDEFLAGSFFDFSFLENRHEVERYWVNEPFAFVSVLYDDEAKEYRYRVVEPTLDTFETYVRQDLVTLLRNSLMYFDFEEDSEAERERVFIENATELIDDHAATVEAGTLHKLLYYLRRDFVHYGPIDPVMRDPAIEDISCDGVDVPVYVYHREYRDLRSNVRFDKRALNSFTVRLAQKAGKQLSVSNPLVDASLPDGSRIQLTMGGDVSTRGSNFTIRKFADIPYSPADLVRWNTFSLEQMAYFWLAIENNKSLLFAGGTGSGKTTSMNAVSFFIPPASKVVTIEDTREIDLPHDNWVQSVTRSSASGEGRGEVSMYNLLQAALRQRPEYLVVGEIRTEQKVALTFFQAMGTGHTAYTTVHADSIETVLSRLQNPPLSIPTQMLQDLDIVSIQRQTFIGDRRVRRNAATVELYPDESNPNEIAVNELFEWNPATDVHEQLTDSRVLADVAHDRGWSSEELSAELGRRQRVLSYLVENDVTAHSDVADTIHMYSRDPEFVMEAVDDERLGVEEVIGRVTVDRDDERARDDGVTDATDDRATWKQLVREASDAEWPGVAETDDGEVAEANGGADPPGDARDPNDDPTADQTAETADGDATREGSDD